MLRLRGDVVADKPSVTLKASRGEHDGHIRREQYQRLSKPHLSGPCGQHPGQPLRIEPHTRRELVSRLSRNRRSAERLEPPKRLVEPVVDEPL